MLGGSFILFYENCWFQFFTTLERIHFIAQHWVPSSIYMWNWNQYTCFWKKEKKKGARKWSQVDYWFWSRLIKTGPVAGVIFITKTGIYCWRTGPSSISIYTYTQNQNSPNLFYFFRTKTMGVCFIKSKERPNTLFSVVPTSASSPKSQIDNWESVKLKITSLEWFYYTREILVNKLRLCCK